MPPRHHLLSNKHHRQRRRQHQVHPSHGMVTISPVQRAAPKSLARSRSSSPLDGACCSLQIPIGVSGAVPGPLTFRNRAVLIGAAVGPQSTEISDRVFHWIAAEHAIPSFLQCDWLCCVRCTHVCRVRVVSFFTFCFSVPLTGRVPTSSRKRSCSSAAVTRSSTTVALQI